MKGLNSAVTLRYASMAHPAAWTTNPAAFPAVSTSHFTGSACGEACYPNLFPGESPDDGLAMMGHDAALVAVRVTRLTNWQDTPDTYRGALIQQWNRLNGLNAVAGASGWISLGKDGVPERKAIPILKLTATGVHFVTLGSSTTDNTPFAPPD